MNKNTYRGDKPKGVGRQNNKQNVNFANNFNGLDEKEKQEEKDKLSKHDDKMDRKRHFERNVSSAKNDEPEHGFDSKNARKAHKNHANSETSRKHSNRSVEATSNKSGKLPSSKNNETTNQGRPKVNRGFLESKAERHKQKHENDAKHSGAVGHPYLRSGRSNKQKATIYGALDLGTNNCRLLLAKPQRRGFRVVDSFSRIIRLGEGLGKSDKLSDEAMDRTIDALKVCSEKMAYRGVHRSRLIATEACRRAKNGAEFIHRVHAETGLKLEIIDQKTEAELAVAGCAALLDENSNYALVFDIGGGSSELILVEISPNESIKTEHNVQKSPFHPSYRIVDWASLPIGVVTLSEKFGGTNVTQDVMADMMAYVDVLLAPFEEKHQIRQKIDNDKIHLLGTSGTVTTVAGIHLKLEQYDRRRIDGFWLESQLSIGVTDMLINMKFEGRSKHPCIGTERADLVLAGCAIFNAIYKRWPAERTRVADRGLREGILTNLMSKDLHYSN